MDPMIGASLITAVGGLLSGMGQGKVSKEQIQASLRQAFANMGMSSEQFEESLRQANAAEGLQVTQQTPNRVGWRQDQAIKEALLKGARNVSVSSGVPGMDRFKPNITGGLRIPEGGFGPDTMKFFSENARLSGEQDLDRAGAVVSDGSMPTPSYGSVYGQAGTNAEATQQALSADLEKSAEKRRALRDQALGRAFNKSHTYMGVPVAQGGTLASGWLSHLDPYKRSNV